MYRHGDVGPDGRIFVSYHRSGPKAGEAKWLSKEAFGRHVQRITERNKTLGAKLKADPALREARNKALRDARQASPAKRLAWNEKMREWHAEDYRRRMLSSARRRAAQQGLPCDLESVDDIKYVTHCPVLGIELRPGFDHNDDASPSLDRIVPTKGYVKGNVIVISLRANRLKSNATLDELQRLAKFYRRFV